MKTLAEQENDVRGFLSDLDRFLAKSPSQQMRNVALGYLLRRGLLFSNICPFYTKDHRDIEQALDWGRVRNFAKVLGSIVAAHPDVVRYYIVRVTPADVVKRAPRLSRGMFPEFLRDAPEEKLAHNWVLSQKVCEILVAHLPGVKVSLEEDIVDLERFAQRISRSQSYARLKAQYLSDLRATYPYQGAGFEERMTPNFELYVATALKLGQYGGVLLNLEGHHTFWLAGNLLEQKLTATPLPVFMVRTNHLRWRNWQ